VLMCLPARPEPRQLWAQLFARHQGFF
jgi:hypothetical protein